MIMKQSKGFRYGFRGRVNLALWIYNFKNIIYVKDAWFWDCLLLWWFWAARNHFQEVCSQKDCPLGNKGSVFVVFGCPLISDVPSALPARRGLELGTIYTAGHPRLLRRPVTFLSHYFSKIQRYSNNNIKFIFKNYLLTCLPTPLACESPSKIGIWS